MEGQHAPKDFVTKAFPHRTVIEDCNSSHLDLAFGIKCHLPGGRSCEFPAQHPLPISTTNLGLPDKAQNAQFNLEKKKSVCCLSENQI